MKRRTFIWVSFVVSSAAALEIWRADRLPEYPGRVVPLDELALKRAAKWVG
ncbi:MAG: hypothetical protein K9M45_00995 [Kiritimatiellales bacterium]|nr:hypothetical protein [Kiritimatiellales bacterium]